MIPYPTLDDFLPVVNSKPMSAFQKKAIAAGFTPNQAAFLDLEMAKFPHEHEIEDVIGLEEALEDDGEEEDDQD